MKTMKPTDEKLKGGGVSISPPPLVVDYGWWAIWATNHDLLSMHKAHATNLVTAQTRVAQVDR